MTATKQLRALLDKRGVTWSAIDDVDMCVTLWDVSGDVAIFREWTSGRTRFECRGLSPEQAVSATLGDGRTVDLEELLRDMHAELVDWAPNSISQLWADRMEQVGVYAGWGWRA